MYLFQSNLGPLLAYAKTPGAQDKIFMAYLSSNFMGKYGNSKLSIHLLVDDCKSLEKLIEQLNVRGLCQAPEHLPYDDHVLQSTAVWIKDQLSLLLC